MTDYQKKRLTKLVDVYGPPVCGGDINAKQCAEVIVPIIRDAILETQLDRETPLVNKTNAERLAREFVHCAGDYAFDTYNMRFTAWMGR